MFDNKIAETVFIEIDKKNYLTKKNIVVCLFYRPPNTQLKKFNEKIYKLLNLIQKEKKSDIGSVTLMYVPKMRKIAKVNKINCSVIYFQPSLTINKSLCRRK